MSAWMHVKPDRRRIDPVPLRLYFFMAFLMIVIALAHVFALQKLNAMRSVPDRVDVFGE
jgi:hypothetical protein